MTTGKMAMIGSLKSKEGKGDEMAAVLSRMVDAAADEPGVEVYSYHRADAETFLFFALMADQESMQQHGQSEAMKAAMEDFMPLMAEPPQMTPAVPVAAVGLEV